MKANPTDLSQGLKPVLLLLHADAATRALEYHVEDSLDAEVQRMVDALLSECWEAILGIQDNFYSEFSYVILVNEKVIDLFEDTKPMHQWYFDQSKRLIEVSKRLFPLNSDLSLLGMKIMLLQTQLDALSQSWTVSDSRLGQAIQQLNEALPDFLSELKRALHTIQIQHFKSVPQVWISMQEEVSAEVEIWLQYAFLDGMKDVSQS